MRSRPSPCHHRPLPWATSTSAGTSSSSTTAPTGSADATTSTSALATDTSVTPGDPIPAETAGPFPADGTNGPNVLPIDGVVRRDMTTSIGDLSGTAAGIPCRIDLTVVDASTGTTLTGAAVYLWHCTADGRYTIYEVEDLVRV